MGHQARDEATTLSIIRKIEEAALRPGQWPLILSQLAEAADGTWGGLVTQELGLKSARIQSIVGLDRPSQKEYETYYFRISPINWHAMRMPVGEVFADHMYPDYRGYLRSEAHNDFFKPRDGHHMLRTNLFRNRELQSYICFRRPGRVGQYIDEEIDWLRILAPYLANAVRVNVLLETERRKTAALIQTLDNLPIGALLANRKGRVVAANTKAETYLSEAGLLRDRAGTSLSLGSSMTAALQRAIPALNDRHPGTCLEVPLRRNAPALELLLFPISPQMGKIFDVGTEEVAVAVFIFDPTANCDIAPSTIGSLYGLTPAEARLTSRLVAEGSLIDAAGSLGITEQTARSTIKRVYAKTGAKGQADLVRVILNGLARFTTR